MRKSLWDKDKEQQEWIITNKANGNHDTDKDNKNNTINYEKYRWKDYVD